MANHRPQLPQRPYEGYPAYGAVHDVAPGPIRDFLYDFRRMADGVFADRLEPTEIDPTLGYRPPDGAEEFDDSPIPLDSGGGVETTELQIIEPKTGEAAIINVSPDYDPRTLYRVFDPDTLGVSVLEMDPSRRQAQAVRTIWEKKDFGAVENEARNEMGRKLPNVVPRLTFNRVEGVGRRMANYPRDDVRQKIALMPDTNKFIETHELIEDEAAIIVRAIQSRLKQFLYPFDTIPHLTFALFRPQATPEQVVTVKEMANDHLARHPLTVRLGELAFRSKLVRSKRKY